MKCPKKIIAVLLIPTLIIIVTCWIGLNPVAVKANGGIQVTNNLKAEYLVNPLGIDVTSPRLSWTSEPVVSGANPWNRPHIRYWLLPAKRTLTAIMAICGTVERLYPGNPTVLYITVAHYNQGCVIIGR